MISKFLYEGGYHSPHIATLFITFQLLWRMQHCMKSPCTVGLQLKSVTYATANRYKKDHQMCFPNSFGKPKMCAKTRRNPSHARCNPNLSKLTSTCQTFSLAPSKLQKRMLTPSRPWPPHTLDGTIFSSRTRCVLLLYTSILVSFSTCWFSSLFRVSSSTSWGQRTAGGLSSVCGRWVRETSTTNFVRKSRSAKFGIM